MTYCDNTTDDQCDTKNETGTLIYIVIILMAFVFSVVSFTYYHKKRLGHII